MSQIQTPDSGTSSATATETPPAAPPRKPRKAGCGCVPLLLLLAGVIGFAPQIITMTTLRNQVPGLVIAGLPPGVMIGSATAGWVSPIQLNDITIPDDQGRPNLKLKHVTLSRSLWELATGASDLGKIDVEKPELKLIVDRGVSNYDRTLARLTGGKGGGKRKLLELKLTDGQIQILEGNLASQSPPKSAPAGTSAPSTDLPPTDGTQTGEQVPADAAIPNESAANPLVAPAATDLEPASTPERSVAIIDLKSASIRSQASGDEELFAELTASLREPAVEQPMTAEVHWNLPDGDASGVGSGKLTAAIPSLPLAILSPWLSPLANGRAVSGVASLNVRAEALPSERELMLGGLIEIPEIDLRLAADDAHPQPYRWTGNGLKLMVEGQGDLGGKLVQLQTAQLRTPFVNADFDGKLTDLPGVAHCDLQGSCNLSLEQFLSVLPPEWSQYVQVSGLKLGQIRMEGDLRSAATPNPAPSESAGVTSQPLRIAADVSWDSGNFWGFQTDNAQVNVTWMERTLSLNPNRLPISGGRWVASPRIEFAPEGRTLVFDGGPVFENVQFTKEMSDSWLKYVSPLLGQATRIEGQFSLSAAPARVRLQAPWSGELSGDLDILGARVSSGPMTRQILEGVAVIQTMAGRQPVGADDLMEVEPQRVACKFTEGRVFHKGLHVSLGDLVVHSSGSVGVDETLDLQFSVPIPDKWTQGKPLLAGLKGEVVPIPVGGTLDQPQVNRQALGDFGKRVGIQSAGGLIEQMIQRRLEKKANGELPAQQPRARPPRRAK